MRYSPEGYADVSKEDFSALEYVVSAIMPSLSGVRFEALWLKYEIALDPPIKGGFTGGAGITFRAIDAVEQMIPGAQERLLKETGKIIFLGNGLSDIPLIATKRHSRGTVKDIPVIVDVFNYELLQRDYERIMEECERSNCPLPLSIQPLHRVLKAINQASHNGHLKSVIYYVGAGKLPNELYDASLIINCMGPNENSIREQVSMLAIGGELYTHYYQENHGDNISLANIPSQTNFIDGKPDIAAHIYTKIS